MKKGFKPYGVWGKVIDTGQETKNSRPSPSVGEPVPAEAEFVILSNIIYHLKILDFFTANRITYVYLPKRSHPTITD